MRRFLIAGVVASLLIAVGVSQLASSDPDGLEYVAEQEGFADTADEHDLGGSPLADYGAGLTDNPVVNTALAGLIGVALTGLVGWGLLRLVRRRDPSRL
jgi:hypothetical protein